MQQFSINVNIIKLDTDEPDGVWNLEILKSEIAININSSLLDYNWYVQSNNFVYVEDYSKRMYTSFAWNSVAILIFYNLYY